MFTTLFSTTFSGYTVVGVPNEVGDIQHQFAVWPLSSPGQAIRQGRQVAKFDDLLREFDNLSFWSPRDFTEQSMGRDRHLVTSSQSLATPNVLANTLVPAFVGGDGGTRIAE
jgi:hypothetical protein